MSKSEPEKEKTNENYNYYIIDQRAIDDIWNRFSKMEKAVTEQLHWSGEPFKSKKDWIEYFCIKSLDIRKELEKFRHEKLIIALEKCNHCKLPKNPEPERESDTASSIYCNCISEKFQ